MNERARKRLEYARALCGMYPQATADQILQLVNAKDKKERDSLRSAVDWLEDYEKYQDRFLPPERE